MGVRSRLHVPLTASEQALLEQLFVEVGPRLVAYVKFAYGLNDDAEDIMAETFSRATHNIQSLRASQRRDLYLLTVARNLCRDRFRKSRVPTLGDEEQHPASPEHPAEVLTRTEEIATLRKAVHGLPDVLREVVALRLSANMKFEDIAELLHVPLGTALSRMHAAVEHLRSTLGCACER
jgi:RNA polymerase sigma-70 factor (ECF subfamily)